MENKLIHSEGVYIYIGILTYDLSKISTIWAEYEDPNELAQIIEQGVTEEWIDSNIFRPIDMMNVHPYYTISNEFDISIPQFLYVFCTVNLEDRFETKSYLSIVDGEIKSITLFSHHKTIDLYLNFSFREENRKELRKIKQKYIINNSDSIEFKFILNDLQSKILLPEGIISIPI